MINGDGNHHIRASGCPNAAAPQHRVPEQPKVLYDCALFTSFNKGVHLVTPMQALLMV